MRRIKGLVATVMIMATVVSGCSSSSGTAPAADSQGNTTEESNGNGTQAAWPTKTLQLICPFAAGGDSDANARWAAQYLTKELGIDVVVVNTTGNGGAVGARAAKEAASDGGTALFSSSAFTVNELSGAIDFGMDDFEFSCIAGENPGSIVCVNKSLGVSSFQELIDYSKAHPGELKMAYNTGATTHAIALQILDAGVDANLVDAGESSDRIAALLGNHIDIIINTYGTVKDYLASGEFVGLGLTGSKNAEYIPEYPCLKEQGFDVSFPNYYFIAFPKGTDPELAKRVSEAWGNVAGQNEEYASAIKDAYFQNTVYYDGEEGRKLMEESRENIVKYTKMFQEQQ